MKVINKKINKIISNVGQKKLGKNRILNQEEVHELFCWNIYKDGKDVSWNMWYIKKTKYILKLI